MPTQTKKPTRRAPARKSARRSTAKAPAKRTAAKSPTKRATAKRSSAKKAPAKKTARKTTVRRAPARRAAPAKTKATVKPRSLPALAPGQRYFALEVPFSLRQWASMEYGARWDSAHRVHVWAGEELPELLKAYAAAPWSWAWHQEAELNGEPTPEPDALEPWHPRPHQVVGAQAIEAARAAGLPGFLLADDVGVGKTMSVWSWVLNQRWAQRVLVVSPLSVRAHWRNTLRHAGTGGRHVLIINYDQLGGILEVPDDLSTRAKGKRKRVAQKGRLPEYDLIIWDEAHKGKNPESARSILMRRLSGVAEFVVWLSATAGQNPMELAYLGPLLAAATQTKIDATTIKAFGEWCIAHRLGLRKGEFGKFVRLNAEVPEEAKEAEQALERMRSLLFDPQRGRPPLALRRLPQDVAGWPEMERQLHPVDVPPEQHQAILKAWKIFQEEESASPAPKARQKKDSSMALVRQLRLRQAISLARIDATVEVIEEMLENDKRVAVSVGFHESIDRLAEALAQRKIPVAIYDGRRSENQREAERMRFQTGKAHVILFSVEEGISLHQGEHENVPRVLLVHDLRWSALQMTQIEGRAHRDGQLAPVFWLYAPGSIDERIAEVLFGRTKSMKLMMGDDTATLAAIEEELYRQAQGR